MMLKNYLVRAIAAQKCACRMAVNCAECASRHADDCRSDAIAEMVIKDLKRLIQMGADIETMLREEGDKDGTPHMS